MKVQDMEHSIPFSSKLERDAVNAVARRGGGDPSAVGLDSMVFDRLLKEHILFLGSDVNSEIANRLCAHLLLLEAEDPERDIKLDTYRASSAGGQNVQKNATAVRLTHLPTGLVVTCQDERSLTQNRLRAMSILRARLYELEETRRQQAEAADRKGQVGTGERSEKIRTYNFPQSRVTDHRLGMSFHNLPIVLNGDLDIFIDELIARDQAEKLSGSQPPPPATNDDDQ